MHSVPVWEGEVTLLSGWEEGRSYCKDCVEEGERWKGGGRKERERMRLKNFTHRRA